MASNQRSILSFFQSSSSSSPSAQQSSSQQRPQHGLPGGPPRSYPPIAPRPPVSGKFVPPPGQARAANRVPPPPQPPLPAASVSRGGNPNNADLMTVTAAFANSVLAAAGAQLAESGDGQDLVFPSAAPPSSSTTSLSLAMPRERHMPDLVSVNAILLSVRYPDSFYKPIPDRTQISSLFNRVVVLHEPNAPGNSHPSKLKETVVGGVTCRLEPSPFSTDPSHPDLAVYVRSLALLSPYRSRGLAAAALDSIVNTAQALNATHALPAVIRCVYAHVWTESDEALQWYDARGFVRDGGEPVPGYYYALRPDTAWLMRRDLPGATEELKKRVDGTLPSTSSSTGPSRAATTAAPPPSAPGIRRGTITQSFQNTRPDVEWNDLPEDMIMPSASASATGSASASAVSSRNASRRDLLLDAAAPSDGMPSDSLAPPPSLSAAGGPPKSGASSQTSSRSNSVMRKKRDRSYPAAMFGQQ